jgi:hypothetical protein
MRQPPRLARLLFVPIIALFLTGVLFSAFSFDTGVRLSGGALLLMTAWLVRYDVARWTIRQTGLPRYIAYCLLSGYVWLGFSGLLALYHGGVVAGPVYDALLHGIFVGFVFSMIFGHAPIIFPAVLNLPIFYRSVLYVPLALLHLSLLTRVIGDLAGWYELRLWGGLLNAGAILLFFASMIYIIGASRRQLSLVHE